MSLDTCIVNACTAAWDQSFIAGTQNKNNCSGFLQSVAATLGVPIPGGNADAIMGGLPQATGWKELASGDEAAQKASQGYFVIAGIRAATTTRRATTATSPWSSAAPCTTASTRASGAAASPARSVRARACARWARSGTAPTATW